MRWADNLDTFCADFLEILRVSTSCSPKGPVQSFKGAVLYYADIYRLFVYIIGTIFYSNKENCTMESFKIITLLIQYCLGLGIKTNPQLTRVNAKVR